MCCTQNVATTHIEFVCVARGQEADNKSLLVHRTAQFQPKPPTSLLFEAVSPFPFLRRVVICGISSFFPVSVLGMWRGIGNKTRRSSSTAADDVVAESESVRRSQEIPWKVCSFGQPSSTERKRSGLSLRIAMPGTDCALRHGTPRSGPAPPLAFGAGLRPVFPVRSVLHRTTLEEFPVPAPTQSDAPWFQSARAMARTIPNPAPRHTLDCSCTLRAKDHREMSTCPH